MSVVARKILFNTVIQVAAKVISGFFSIIILNLLTNYLGVAGYGFYKSIYEFLALFAIVADLGLYTIGVREMSKNPDKESMILGNLLSIRTGVILLISAVAVGASFAVRDFQNPLAPWAIGLACLTTVFAILTGTVSTVLQVHLKMEWNSLGSVLGKVASLGYMAFVILFWFPHSCDAGMIQFLQGSGACHITDQAFMQLIFAGLVGNVIMFGTVSYFTSKLVKIRYRFDWAFWKDVIWKALPYGIALVLNQLYFRIGSIVLLNMEGKESVAIYGAALTMLESAGIIPLYFMNAVLPVLTKAISEKKDYQSIIQYAFDFLVMGSLPIVVGTLALAYQLIAVIANEEFLSDMSRGFYGSDVVLQILIIAIFFSFINGLFGYILVAVGKQEKMLVRNLLAAILVIILSFFLIPIWKERGAAVANIVTEIYITIASFFIARRYLKFNISLVNTGKIAVSSLVMGIFVWSAKDFSYQLWNLQNKGVLLLIPVAGLIYLGMLLITRAITKEMIAVILKRKPVPETLTHTDAGPDQP